MNRILRPFAGLVVFVAVAGVAAGDPGEFAKSIGAGLASGNAELRAAALKQLEEFPEDQAPSLGARTPFPQAQRRSG